LVPVLDLTDFPVTVRVYKHSLVYREICLDNKNLFMNRIRIYELGTTGDDRGLNLALPPEALKFVGKVKDVHVSSSISGGVRGNHYHLRKRRAMVVMPGVAWSLHWDAGKGTAIQRRSFDGGGVVLLLIPPGASHAVRNDGNADLWMVACSSAPYDASQVVMRTVV
jgi:dTDP-4-dehydrorhamnose 3,5-epimerase-like enzyme